jgi:glutamine amidotransferase
LMCRHTEENETSCLDIFPLEVREFPPDEKVPHMGWNTISNLKGPLMKGVNEEAFLYFVHSYYAEISTDCIAASHYAVPFCAALQKDNFYAVQAHPEKSSETGSIILQNFLNI